MSREVKSKDTKDIFLGILFYLLFSLFTWSFLYIYQLENDFSAKNFITASVLFFIFSIICGYLLVTYLLNLQHKIRKQIIKVSDEVMHELNIPLSTITTNASMIRKNLQDEKDIVRLNRIEKATQKLKRLYENLVYDITKDVLPIQKELFYVDDVMRECSSYFMEQNRNVFVFDMDETQIMSDKLGFEQVIDNLLSNAMKYSDKNSKISIALKDMKLEIEDEGIGIDETQILHIHELYYQGNSESEGKGIGLSLVKKFCDKNHIDFTISSKKDIGTKVTLDLKELKA
ncbi:MAG: HAMP domain-containing histidine kinase [Campylobacterales bacterium]|nr:HAMP domain-containing histidine kinase [Campylobacterales bacterium]